MHTQKLQEMDIKVSSRDGNQKTTCPQCSSSRKKKSDPCLSVNTGKGVWNCHNCGWTGTVAKQESKYKRPEYVAPESDLPQHVQDWFSKRKIKMESVTAYNISTGKAWMPQTGKEEGVLMFPFYRDGEVCNIKYRTKNKEFKQAKDAEKILFGLNHAVGKKVWVWVEGELDILALHTSGIYDFGLVSVPDGAPNANAKNIDKKMEFLHNCRQEIAEVDEHIIAVDNDENGIRLEYELARRLGVEKCFRVRWHEGSKDANDTLINHGWSEVKKLIENAKPFPVKGIVRIEDMEDEIHDFRKNGTLPGASVGYECLENLYKPRAGEWTIVTGMPGSGKSEFLDQLAIKLVQSSDWRFAVFSPENQPLVLHFQKLAEKSIGIPWSQIGDEQLQNEIIPWVNEYFTFLPPGDEETTLDGIIEKARICVTRYGINGLIIDPWNEIDHSRPGNLTETEYISKALTKLRKFARAVNIHIWVMAHPQKLENRGKSGYPVARPYDISGSAHFYNKADNCMSIWRDMKTNKVEIHIQKVRFKDVGRVGIGVLEYDRNTGQYHQALNQERISK